MLGGKAVVYFLWVAVHGIVVAFAAHKVREILAKVYAGRRGPVHIPDIVFDQPSALIGRSSRPDMPLD